MDSEKEISIENLYTKVGFNSRSTFNRAFKEITGKSPSEYLSLRKSA
jgi:AraC-like DNA-binding protein